MNAIAGIIGQPQMPLNNVARLCLDYADRRSLIVIDLIQQAGLRVLTIPVSGLIEPHLTFGTSNYRGIEQIQKFAADQKNNGK